MSAGRRLSATAASASLAGLLVGIPAFLYNVGPSLPTSIPTGHQVSQFLARPLSDTDIVTVLSLVGWVIWALFALAVAVEIVAYLQGRPSPSGPKSGFRLPGLQRVAGSLFLTALVIIPQRNPTGTLAVTTAPSTLAAQQVAVAVPAARATPALASLYTPPAPPVGAVIPAGPRKVPYTVARYDCPWGIAEAHLRDGLRWREITDINGNSLATGTDRWVHQASTGRDIDEPQAVTIYPGQTLLLPADATGLNPPAAEASPAPPPPDPPAPIPGPTVSPDHPTPAPTSPGPVTGPAPSGRTAAPTSSAPGHDESWRRAVPVAPVKLPSGSLVAGTFAAGVLSAIGAGQLRRRHAYRYTPPQPGRDLAPSPAGPTLRHLSHAVNSDDELAAPDDGRTQGPGVPAEGAPRQQPEQLDIGVRDNQIVTVDPTALSGTTLTGPRSDDIARALLAGVLVNAEPGAAEVIVAAALGERLLPDLAATIPIRVAPTVDDITRILHAEMIARARRLDTADSSDAASYRTANPEDPLPLLAALIDDPPEAAAGRWAALSANAARLGIAALALNHHRPATGTILTDAACTVTDAPTGNGLDVLVGTRMFALTAPEAVELLNATALSPPTEPALEPAHASAGADGPNRNGSALPAPTARLGEPGDDLWPEPVRAEHPHRPPLDIHVLGPYRIVAHGKTVTSGLRNRAKMLLAWYLLRPEGATSEAAVDALWPNTDPNHVHKQFWRPLGELRTRLRGPAGEPLEVITKTGSHYQPAADEIRCDLWDFQQALGDAALADNADRARAALRAAVDAYGGDLLEASDDPWVEAARHDLHRRAVDAHLRLAELDDHAGHPDIAGQVLEHAIDLDRYGEEPYRRLMSLHAAHGRPDAVTATWQLLNHHLDTLDLDLDAATVRLYQALTVPK